VPIRINIEQDGYKFRDQFTWNIADKTITVCAPNVLRVLSDSLDCVVVFALTCMLSSLLSCSH
jgi:hypothetical protein